MTDRLQQIWAGFERVTERRLTGRGVDNIMRPAREEFRAAPEALPADVTAPAEAAFTVLRTRLASEERKAAKRRKGRRRDEAQTFEAEVTDYLDDRDYASAPKAAQEMIRGLKATEDRTVRRTPSYVAMMSSQAGRELASLKKRRKFLGIF